MLESIETKNIILADETATLDFGRWLASRVNFPSVIFLQGELGAGKTTLIRGFLRGLGFEGSVKSPTFTLVEEYTLEKGDVYHFDLYRLNFPEELESIGIREYFKSDSIVLLEWPERGKGFLPKADLLLILKIIPGGRELFIQSSSENEILK